MFSQDEGFGAQPSMNANTPDLNADALIELARNRFGDLTPAEEEMFRAAAKGEFADCTFGDVRLISSARQRIIHIP